MRVLFCAGSGFGHVQPLLPLARAFRDAGDEVAFATAETWRAAIGGEPGVAFLPAGLSPADVDAAFAPTYGRLQSLPPLERRPIAFATRFGEVEGPARLDDLRRAVDTFRPDLLAHESADLAAPLVAAERGLPAVNHSFGRPIPIACLSPAATAFAPYWEAAGLEPDPLAGAYRGVLLDLWPTALGADPPPPGAVIERMRPATAAPPTVRGGSRPLVYVTLGTAFNDPGLFRTIFEGLGDLHCDVLATLGADADPETVGPVPANVQLEQFVPQAELLPGCTLAVSHGGSGSTLGALAHGLPLLLLPRGADQFENAQACAVAGVGRVLTPPEVSAGRIAEAVSTLLTDPACTARARAVAAEIAGMPSPAEAAEALRAWATA